MTEVATALPNAVRTVGLCLALSGGGFRATLFHLGVLRRLNELGLISRTASISSLPSLYAGAPSLAIPYPEWMPEARARDALKDSSKRRY